MIAAKQIGQRFKLDSTPLTEGVDHLSNHVDGRRWCYKLVVLSNVDNISFKKGNAGGLEGFNFDAVYAFLLMVCMEAYY